MQSILLLKKMQKRTKENNKETTNSSETCKKQLVLVPKEKLNMNQVKVSLALNRTNLNLRVMAIYAPFL